eukprot:gb/GFBE01030451.1/.p1 GENE.gb/GFBE01030451.1/~~gb/GFBE01030451.1/.p1  ORF type:complete len:109 (+),score=21.49 gb/GFBE01030451.1/:1-327(+)
MILTGLMLTEWFEEPEAFGTSMLLILASVLLGASCFLANGLLHAYRLKVQAKALQCLQRAGTCCRRVLTGRRRSSRGADVYASQAVEMTEMSSETVELTEMNAPRSGS